MRPQNWAEGVGGTNMERRVGDEWDDMDDDSPIAAPQQSEEYKAFEAATKRSNGLKLQKQLVSAQNKKLKKSITKVKKQIRTTQERLERWEERLSNANTDAEKEVIFRDELVLANRNGDTDTKDMLKEHARKEREKERQGSVPFQLNP